MTHGDIGARHTLTNGAQRPGTGPIQGQRTGPGPDADVEQGRHVGAQRGQVLSGELAQGAPAGDAGVVGHHLGRGQEEAGEALGRDRRIQSAAQHRVLRGDADRTGASVTRPVLLTADRHHRCGGQSDGVGPEGHRLGHLVGRPVAPGHHQLDVGVAVVVEPGPGAVQRHPARDADVVTHMHRSSPGPAAEAVDDQVVGSDVDADGDVVVDAPGRDLDADRDAGVDRTDPLEALGERGG